MQGILRFLEDYNLVEERLNRAPSEPAQTADSEIHSSNAISKLTAHPSQSF
jgi:hypothetical protein